MNKILLVGYTRKNVGDDLFLSMLIHRYKDYNIEIFCPKKFSTPFLNAKNVSIIDDNFFESNKIKIDNYSMCIYVGGSIFKESAHDYKMKEWLYNFVLKCKEKDIPFYFISSNFGPYQSKEYFELCKSLIKDSSGINFREKYSFELFKLKNTKYVPDLVLSLNYKKKKMISGSVGISLIDLYGLPRGEIDKSYFEYMDFLKNNIEKYIDEGHKVYLYSFCEHERDEIAIETLMSFMDSKYTKQLNIVKYNGNLKPFLDIYSRMEYVMCTRFHAMILSALFNQKIIVCNYSKKISNVIKDYGYLVPYLEINKDIKDKIITLEEYKECSNNSKVTKLSFDNYIEIDKTVNIKYNQNKEYNSDFECFYKKNTNSIKKLGSNVLRKVGVLKKPKKKETIIDNKKVLDDTMEKGIIDNVVYNNCLKKLDLDYKSIKEKSITKGPLVSIVTDNKDIESIKNQTYKNIEIINSNSNIKGKYVIYVTNDNYIDNRFIEKAVNKFEENENINIVAFNSFNYNNGILKFKRVGFNGLCNCLDYIKSFGIEYYVPDNRCCVFRNNNIPYSNSLFIKSMKSGLMYIFNDPVYINEDKVLLSPKTLIDELKDKKEIYLYLKENNLITNPDYWWYLQNKTTMELFISSKPSFKKFNIIFKWCLKNMNKYKRRFRNEILKKQIKEKI